MNDVTLLGDAVTMEDQQKNRVFGFQFQFAIDDSNQTLR